MSEKEKNSLAVRCSECTRRCRSRQHADLVSSAISKATDAELISYLTWICYNAATGTDSAGRSPLHVAASCGRRELVEWLVQVHGVPLNTEDAESGMTALQRAVFYGQLSVVRALLILGADPTTQDHADMTAYDGAHADRLPLVELSATAPCEAYVWGSNPWFSIGVERIKARQVPEPLDLFRRAGVWIKQIKMTKFHTVFLAQSGEVYTCGHGIGGRLGTLAALVSQGSCAAGALVGLFDGFVTDAILPKQHSVVDLPGFTCLVFLTDVYSMTRNSVGDCKGDSDSRGKLKVVWSGSPGHGDEESVLVPKRLKTVKGEHCVQVAASVDHTVLLMESGTVWTFGLNQHCQLGHSPPPPQLTAPRLVEWSRARPDRITGVGAARYHTVLWNEESLYCMGLNGGQMGQHKDENKDKRFILPRKVTMLDRGGAGGTRLTHVACSEGATAVATAAGDVYVLSQYRCRRIASKLLNLRQVRVDGGAPDAELDGRRSERAAPLRLLLLSAAGRLLIWREDCPVLTGCVVGLRRELCVADAELDRHGLILISESGQAFTGTVLLPKQPQPAAKTAKDGKRAAPAGSAGPASRQQYAQVRVTRVPHIHRAVSVTCDGCGGNAAAVQCDPRAFLLEVPQVSSSEMREDFAKLLNNADEMDSIHDIVIQAGQTRFPCHRYILASGSSWLSQQLVGGGGGDGGSQLRLDGTPPAAVRQVLQFLYTGTCDLMRPGPTEFRLEPGEGGGGMARPNKQHQKGKTREKPVQPLQVVRDVAKKLGVNSLYKRLEGVRLAGGRIEVPRNYDDSPSAVQLDPSGLAALSDVTLVSSDGVALAAHRCVLAARLQYFSVMFGSCWAESSSSSTVQMSMPAAVLSALVRYCYTDETLLRPDDPEPLMTDDLELLCGLLAAADHLLAGRLKQMCEVALSRQLTLKNAVELMEFSSLYGADQLKTTCMQFICLNLAAIMENRSLDQASDEVMDELTRHYRRVNPVMRSRLVRPSAGPPTLEHIRDVHRTFPVGRDEPPPPPPEEEVRCRQPPRRRPPARRTVSASSGPDQEPARTRAASTSSAASLAELEAASEDGLDLSDLMERDHTSPVPEFTLVTRKRQPERPAVPQPSPEPAPERYIPGMTPRPRPARAVRQISAPDDAPAPPADVTPDQSPAAAVSTSPSEAFPSLGSAFPALTSDVIVSASRVSPSSPTEKPRECKKSSKKGRRGRPLNLDGSLPAQPASPAGKSSDVTPKPVDVPRKPAWGGGQPGAASASSLAEIMAQEAGAAAPAALASARPAPRVPAPAPLSPSSPGGDSVWGSPASPPAAWRPLATPATEPGAASLTDIIRQERQKIESRQQMSNKSLALIQIEERAIQELLELHDAAGATSVRITVSREQADTAEPQWKLQRR